MKRKFFKSFENAFKTVTHSFEYLSGGKPSFFEDEYEL
jgi:hypothetical protein